MAIAGAIIVAATAWARMALSVPPDAGKGITTSVTSPDPLTSLAKQS
jgi:hypothetical protein